MALTIKQEKFCQELITTGNASAAYREAYNTEKMKPESVNRSAKQLLDNTKIATRLQELRAPAVEKAQLTLEQHLNDLKRLRDKAEMQDRYGDAIRAEVARGKAAGLHIEKHELGGVGGGPIGVIVVPAKTGN